MLSIAAGFLASHTLVSEVFRKAGIKSDLDLIEENFITQCPSCGESFPLSECSVADDEDGTIYSRRCCDATILIVSSPIDIPRKGYGYRLKDYVIRNATDIRFGKVLIPASPDALAGTGKGE
ncbi:MAG: hypothetical protein CMQ43_06000 [Gammaproteobacteria bacterium]|nr:hypothetical protein [Gammaproteobacteria bacterium]MBK80453.1 hypothetical protein [Gammaproteobacteria bacterium]|tara:strand:- start:4502 stop:4867 length:366 start_codon:yes stop_codon:yes gene_type:complete